MSDFTFLTKEQIDKGVHQLDIIGERGAQAEITDYAILLGGAFYATSETEILGEYWTKSDDNVGYAVLTRAGGHLSTWGNSAKNIGARLVLPLTSVSRNIINRKATQTEDGISQLEYGYYPQKVAPKEIQERLNSKTENVTYSYNVYTKGLLKEDKNLEYKYNGKRYVKIIADFFFSVSVHKLSNGETYKSGEHVWVEVLPVNWLIDEKAGLMLTEKIIFAGIPFQYENNYKTEDFDKTYIKQYIDTYLAKEIMQGMGIDLTQNNGIQTDKQVAIARKKNPYDLNFNEVSEEEIIRGAIESDVPVFLHGRSSEGKSARVKQLDPDCEKVYLATATPESLNGMIVHNSERRETIDIAPTWYKKLCEKCEKEPNKTHILFFDEMTNAVPAIQGMAFNIILDKEVNGKWKLPENCRIVAAGNELSDSLAANQIAEPLYNRFAHVYIETKVNDWLKWASTPKGQYEKMEYDKKEETELIHPSIYAFIAYRGEKALRSTYTGEKPNADPRKWEMASKILYKTKNPEMLRALVGEEITNEFIHFCKQKVITLEDVIEGRYNETDLSMNISEKYATAVALSMASEEEMEKVRGFIDKELGAEPCAVFDSLWIKGDETRMEKIMELRVSSIDKEEKTGEPEKHLTTSGNVKNEVAESEVSKEIKRHEKAVAEEQKKKKNDEALKREIDVCVKEIMRQKRADNMERGESNSWAERVKNGIKKAIGVDR